MRNWRLALRLARREALRARGRSVLVLVLILLPVLAVTAADVIYRTAQVSGGEGVSRRIGAADARVDFLYGGRVEQGFDPDSQLDTGASVATRPTPPTVRSVLGGETRLERIQDGEVRVLTRRGVADVSATEVDLRDPLTQGLFVLDSGRLPRDADEVAVTPALAARGPALNDSLRLLGGERRTVVGVVDATAYRNQPSVVGPIGSLGLVATSGQTSYLVDSPGPVLWSQVRRLNAAGASVISRSVLTDPPPRSVLPSEFQHSSGRSQASLSVLALVVAMVLLEVVLLAGPAFAVGARRQQRTLALLGAAGGTPRQMRRVVLGNGVVLGGVATVLGVLLGLVVGWALLPVFQGFVTARFGPFDVSVRDVAGVALFGLLSAVLAAVAPAWSASRQDLVAVLGGRRGDRPAGARSPALGLVLLAAGVGLAAYGARASGGESTIAFSALVCVVGMILLVPVVMRMVGRAVRRLPLVIRYAARDAARHRTRTVPAVAAVAATVAGVVALGIGVTSSETADRETYQPQVPVGEAIVGADDPTDATWNKLAAAVTTSLPGSSVTPVRSVAPSPPGKPLQQIDVGVAAPGADTTTESSDFYRPLQSSGVLVDDGTGELERLPLGLSRAQVGQARRALASGRTVVFSPRRQTADRADITVRVYGRTGEVTGKPVTRTVPATYLRVSTRTGRAQALLPQGVATGLDLPVATGALVVSGAPISTAREQDLRERLGALSATSDIYVERGFETTSAVLIVQLVLGALGVVLMLGGTLTATFLALSDARGDLGTLSAVGAAPRTRRRVAAAYAGVIGGVGAVLGAAVGFVPGIAVSFPLTRQYSGNGGVTGEHFLDVPWLLVIGVVLVLPVLTSLLVGLTARGRLPLVSRVE